MSSFGHRARCALTKEILDSRKAFLERAVVELVFEKVSPLKCHSNFFKVIHIYLYIYVYKWTPVPNHITPVLACACSSDGSRIFYRGGV